MFYAFEDILFNIKIRIARKLRRLRNYQKIVWEKMRKKKTLYCLFFQIFNQRFRVESLVDE